MNEIISISPTAVYPLSKAFPALQISRGKGYEEIKADRLKTYKVGRRRFTTGAYLLEYISDRQAEYEASQKK